MAYEKRDMSGTLFKNDRKEQPNHADYRGEIRIDGRDFWLSCWIKEGKSGKFMSLAVKPKDGTSARPDPAQEFKREAQRVFPDAQLDDDVPF
jgi:hypothetical protein